MPRIRTFAAIFLLSTAGAPFAARAQMQSPDGKKHFIEPPKPEEIASVSGNMMMIDYGTGELDVILQKERVMEFLSKGEVRPVGENRDKLWDLAGMTIPDSIKNNPQIQYDGKGMEIEPAERNYFNSIVRAEGVLVTKKHKFFFFLLFNDRVLDLTDNSGGECAFVLGPDAGTSAPWLKHFFGFSSAGEPALDEGRMPVPKPMEVAAVVNRTDGSVSHIPIQISEKRIKKFLSDGKPDPQEVYRGGNSNGYFILPKKIDAVMLPQMQSDARSGRRWGEEAMANGVMALRNGEIIFWSLDNDFVLRLCDSQHRTCVLRLREEKPDGDGVAHFGIAGHAYETTLPRESVMNEPDWNVGDKPPPLGEDDAAEIARSELAKIVGAKAISAWRVINIDLQSEATAVNKWYYTVRLIKPLEANDAPASPPALIEVYRDGQVYRDDAVVFVSMEGKPGKIEDLGNGE